MMRLTRYIQIAVVLSWIFLPIAASADFGKPEEKEGYTINFDNVNIKEFVRFISKIGKLNFIFNEQDLNFNVTIVSEDETSLPNILSALVQVLRMHDLLLIEEDQNYIIHKRADVRQIPTIVSPSIPLAEGQTPAIVTKVFQIQNGNPSRLASLISPLLSAQALVEVAADTRQLIITDTYSSITNVGLLISSIDTVNNSVDMYPYQATSTDILTLSQVASDVVKLLATETPILLIPQVQSNTIFIVSTAPLAEKVIKILKDLDQNSGSTKNLTTSNTFNYPIQQGSASTIISSLKDLIEQAKNQGFDTKNLEHVVEKAQYVSRTNSLVFVGSEADLNVIKKFLETIYQATLASSSFYLFNAGSIPIQELQTILKEVSEHFSREGISNPLLFNTIASAKVLPQINAILFTADETTLTDLKALLASIQASYNQEVQISGPMRFLIYQIKNAQEEQIRKSLHQLADSLETNHYTDSALIEAIDSMQWIRATNALIFTGHEKALVELQGLLPSFDISPDLSKTALNQLNPSTNFISYRPIKVSPNYIVEALHSLAKNLEESKLAAPDLLYSLQTSRYDKTSDQVIVTGTPASLERVNIILRELDQEHGSTLHQKNTFTIPINYANKTLVENSLKDFAHTLPADDSTAHMIETMHWLPDSQLLVFQGSAADMNKIRVIIERVDVKANTSTMSTFTVVKIKSGRGEGIVADLRQTSKRLASDGHTARSLIDTLNSATWNAGSNTILLTGTKSDIEQAKELINTFDVDAPSIEGAQTDLYKLIYITPEEAKNLLMGIAEHTNSQGKTEFSRQLYTTIESIRVVPNTDTIQFVGTPAVNKKIEEWLKTLDNPTNAQGKVKQVAGSNVLVYHVKNTTAQGLLDQLNLIAKDLKKNSEADQAVILVIQNARILPNQNNTIVFTGAPNTLAKLQTMLETLDIGTPKPVAPQRSTLEVYKLYTPKNVPGHELIQYLQHFEQHLFATGVQEPGLSEVVDHLTYLEKTNSIIVSGSSEGVEKVMDLLARFDVQGGGGPQQLGDIEIIDDMGFLNYKIQFHNGADIVKALKAIGKDLGSGKDAKNQNLMEAIQSLQWIDVTNSLIASGQPRILTKVKELIESVDQPLKQVFIEVLVLETTMNDTLDFGLRWASQGKYNKQLGWGTGMFQPTDTTNLATVLPNINATNTPTGASIAPIGAGYLGVIGDIITHKGNSYATLASLLTALKTDSDATVVLSQKIITQDNRNSRVFVGENVPFTGSLVTTAGLSQTTNANLEYRNIGVTLSITPFVGNNGIVTLDIEEEISEEENTGSTSSSVSSQSVNGIRTSKTSMQTRAHVPDRHFLVLSGMVRNSTTRVKSGIPCLGGLPVIGAAFSEVQKVTEKRNVIIFVKPHIIDSPALYDQITRAQEELFGSKDQSNQEDFQAGIEIVRSVDDEEYSQ